MMKRANLILMAALAAAGLTSVTGALLAPAVAVAQAEGQKIGAKMAKPLRAAQEAIAAKNFDAALAQLAEAAAIEPKTPYEAFMVDELGWYAMVQKKDYAAAADTLARTVTSGFVPEADLPRRYKALTQLNTNSSSIPRRSSTARRHSSWRRPTPKSRLLVGHSLYLGDDFAAARAWVDGQVAAGGKPNEQLLLIGLRSNYELNDKQGTMRALESLLRHYPAQKYWVDLLNNQLYETKADRDLRALYRLMVDTNTLSKPEEYSEMVTTLMTGGFPTEAKQILERGLAANVFTGDSLTRAQADLQRARVGADADRKELPGADAALAAAKTGNEMIAMGKLFFSVGDYAKAADAFRKGLAAGLGPKGGDVDDANALLGIALVRSGKSGEAVEAFDKVGDPKLAEVTRLWKLYIETSTQVAAPPAAAPAG
jgi:tetratricopeptide (TPR) repeat protein